VQFTLTASSAGAGFGEDFLLGVARYLRGTRILTDRGERPIETLRIGDWVATGSGALRPIRWIGRRRYHTAMTEGRAAIAPVLIRRDALGDDLPRRNLLVSPEHALFLDGMLVPARHLTNGVSVLARNGNGPIDYFHIELDAHAVIFAEGVPAETFVDCGSRALFDNAADHRGGGAPRWAFCAPRVEEGERLADLRHRLAVRAGIAAGDWRAATPGRLIGNLERAEDNVIEGWAQDVSAPERPVLLEILADDRPIRRVVANAYRRDLEQGALGSGRHAFRVRFDDGAVGSVAVRRVHDRAPLPGSPRQVAAAGNYTY
jgi:hypothetical protein